MSHPRTAMLLAAGPPMPGASQPTPLLRLAGRALVDHALDRLADAGVETVVVNARAGADPLAAHLAARRLGPRTVLRAETEPLDTGGAVHASLDLLGAGPFYVVNADTFWLDGPSPALARLAAAWNPAEPAPVLLVHRCFQVQSETGDGDFAMDPWGRLRRRREREIVPYLYAGLQLLDAAIVEAAAAHASNPRFGMNALWRNAMDEGRLRGVVHDGLWFHMDQPADLAEAEHNLHARALGEAR